MLIKQYFNAGYYLTPVKNKIPVYKGWQNFQSYDSYEESLWHKNNVGLLTGRNIVVVDIDYEDEHTKELIKPILDRFYTRIQRKGNRERLPSLFYRTDIDIPSTSFGKIDILGIGKQCVIPPSKHENGHNYEWVYESLLEAGDYLPEFDFNLIEELKSVLNLQYSSSKNEGRNNHLVKVVTAKISEAKDPTTIINELIQYDKKHHADHPNGPLFEDRKEGARTGIPFYEASRLYFNNMRTQVNKNNFQVPFKFEITEIEEPVYEEKAHKNRAWETKFEGILSEVFDYIYDSCHVPHTRFVIPSVLATVGTALGNKIHYRDTHPNFFSIILGTASSGKRAPMTLPLKILESAGLGYLKGFETITHAAQLNGRLSESACRLDMLDEIHNLFSAMSGRSHTNLNGVAEWYSRVWDAPNTSWSGQFLMGEYRKNKKSENVGKCFSPFVNVLGACNIERFIESFNESLAEQGFASRCLFFIDDQNKRKDFEKNHSMPVPQRIIDFITYCNNITPSNSDTINFDGHFDIFEVPMSSLAKFRHIQYSKKLEDKAYRLRSDDPFLATMSRAQRYFTKFAIIDAVSRSFETLSTPLIDEASVEWAYRFIKEYLLEAAPIFKNMIGHDERDKYLKSMLNVIKSQENGITKRNLRRKFKKLTQYNFDEILQTLNESGLVECLRKGHSEIYNAK